jgi:hypothetical protein
MSGNDLFQKMFVKPGMKFLVVGLPQELQALYDQVPDGLSLLFQPELEADVIQVFVKNEQELRTRLEELPQYLKKPSGILWISYPKGTSGVSTDINRDSLWPIAASFQFSPNRQVSVDDVWSALRFKQMNG